MKIGIMLRHLDQHGGGVLVYTKSLLQNLFAMNSEHEYILMYQNPDLIGSYNVFPNVKEIAVTMPSKLLWDQIAVGQIEKTEKLDIIFNPKYSVPLRANCPTVFVCHGLDWYVMPWGSKWYDRLSHKFLIPRYTNKAKGIISVSDTARNHLKEFLGVEEQRSTTIYLGLDDNFRQPAPEDILSEVRIKYDLPEKYFLYVGQIYPPKNFGRLLQAYAKTGPKTNVHLVIAGSHTWLCENDLKLIKDLGIEDWIVRPGWIDRQTLPVFYQLASALVLPSLYEACPSPPIEAMANGCPVLTADRYGTQEIVDNAGLLVNPEDIDAIASGMERIVTDNELRADLIEKGFIREKHFTWKKCAEQTIEFLEKTVKTPCP